MLQVQTQGQTQGQTPGQTRGQIQNGGSMRQAQDFSARHPPRPPLLARYAENILWLARYMERVENLARLLDVTRTFASDQKDARHWRAILRINADEERFLLSYPDVTPENVARFFLLDTNNPTSILMVIEHVRETARSLRAVISPEIWSHINMVNGQLRALTQDDIAPQNLSAVCSMLKDAVQAHTGITDGTFYRDQSWAFYAIGRHLERADQMTRLVDIKYAAMKLDAGDGAGVEASLWSTLLRAAGGYHSYRRVYLHGYSAEDVAGFLLLDGAFPRSVDLNLCQLHGHLAQLRDRYGLDGGQAALTRLDSLRNILSQASAAELVQRGLPPFLDWMQRQFVQLHDDIASGFFPQP